MSAHGGHDHGGRAQSKRALAVTLALTTTFTVAEVVGGLLTGSLALLADAAHMLSDDVSLALALGAVWLAERPPTPQRSFGWQRVEILAALANGVTLVAISIWIFIEAFNRLEDPPDVAGGGLLAVALAGLAVNVVGFMILRRGQGESLNVSAAARHVLADLMGSIGVIVAAVVILATGWRYIDPIISVLIGLLVLASSWSILRDSVRILLEASPRDLDVEQLGTTLAGAEGVVEVHDLHVWTITSGFPALAAHVIVGREEDCHARRRQLERLLKERFGIEHTTLQVEHEERELIQLEAAEQHSPGNRLGR